MLCDVKNVIHFMKCMWVGKHVIYVMTCRGYGEEYISETETFLRKRVTVHNQHIRDPKTRMLKVSDNCANMLEPKYTISPSIRCTHTV